MGSSHATIFFKPNPLTPTSFDYAIFRHELHSPKPISFIFRGNLKICWSCSLVLCNKIQNYIIVTVSIWMSKKFQSNKKILFIKLLNSMNFPRYYAVWHALGGSKPGDNFSNSPNGPFQKTRWGHLPYVRFQLKLDPKRSKWTKVTLHDPFIRCSYLLVL